MAESDSGEEVNLVFALGMVRGLIEQIDLTSTKRFETRYPACRQLAIDRDSRFVDTLDLLKRKGRERVVSYICISACNGRRHSPITVEP